VVALASRVVMTVGDLAWAGAGLAIGRSSSGRRSASRPAEPAGRQPSPAPGPRA
jgi:hypothetical protein